MFFANEQRDTVREENPGISFGELDLDISRSTYSDNLAGQVGKVLGDKWKALSEKQREPYEKKAAADKKRYEEEKAKYNVCSSDPFPTWRTLTFLRLVTRMRTMIRRATLSPLRTSPRSW
jgi:hypothetical protein